MGTMARRTNSPTAPTVPFTPTALDGTLFTALELAGLLAAGATPAFCRTLLTTFKSKDAWLSAPLLPDEKPSFRSAPAYDPPKNLQVIGCMDPRYPAAFFDLSAPPPALFVEGEPTFHPSVAVVGSRAMSSFGATVATLAATTAVSAGATVLSGLAAGVDSTAHRAALDAGGRSSAFVANLTSLSPEQRSLADRLIDSGGFLCSEHPPLTPFATSQLLARNRLIAALAYPLIPVEGTLESGTVSTLRTAAALGRPVLTATPRPSFRSLPTAALPLALGLDPTRAAARFSPPVHFKNVSASSPTAANAVCTTREEFENCLKVLFWLHREPTS